MLDWMYTQLFVPLLGNVEPLANSLPVPSTKQAISDLRICPEMLSIELQAPRFEDDGSSIQRVSAPRTHLLTRLGYKNGKMTQRNNSIVYRQKAYGKVSCEVALKWNSPAPQVLEGSYCITTQGTWYSETIQAADFMKEYAKNFQTALVEHTNWWNTYWEKSQIHLPDPVLENQWYLEMYKFGFRFPEKCSTHLFASRMDC